MAGPEDSSAAPPAGSEHGEGGDSPAPEGDYVDVGGGVTADVTGGGVDVEELMLAVQGRAMPVLLRLQYRDGEPRLLRLDDTTTEDAYTAPMLAVTVEGIDIEGDECTVTFATPLEGVHVLLSDLAQGAAELYRITRRLEAQALLGRAVHMVDGQPQED